MLRQVDTEGAVAHRYEDWGLFGAFCGLENVHV